MAIDMGILSQLNQPMTQGLLTGFLQNHMSHPSYQTVNPFAIGDQMQTQAYQNAATQANTARQQEALKQDQLLRQAGQQFNQLQQQRAAGTIDQQKAQILGAGLLGQTGQLGQALQLSQPNPDLLRLQLQIQQAKQMQDLLAQQQGQPGGQPQEAGQPTAPMNPQDLQAKINSIAAITTDPKDMMNAISQQAQQRFMQGNDLRQQYNTQAAPFQEINNAYQRMLAGAAPSPDGKHSTGDIAILYNFMKMVAPTMRLNEGSAATAENTVGVPDKLREQYNSLVGGHELMRDQRIDLLKKGQALYQSQAATQQTLANQYKQQAIQQGLNPNTLNVTGVPENLSDIENKAFEAANQAPELKAPKHLEGLLNWFERRFGNTQQQPGLLASPGSPNNAPVLRYNPATGAIE